MTTIDNKIKMIGQYQCKDHRDEDIVEVAYLTPDKAPLLSFFEALHLHEVFEVEGKMLCVCPKRSKYKRIPKGSQLFMRFTGTTSTFAWIEDAL